MAKSSYAGGWVCTHPDCERKAPGKLRCRTSSLVRSNFKFTKDGKPICTRCWGREKLSTRN